MPAANGEEDRATQTRRPVAPAAYPCRARVVIVGELTHVPRRPAWECDRCGQEWPCAPAKIELSDRYQTALAELAVFMGLRMWDAFDEGIGETSRVPIPPALHQRFLGWLFIYQHQPLGGRQHGDQFVHREGR